jgi:hypothetical protein
MPVEIATAHTSQVGSPLMQSCIAVTHHRHHQQQQQQHRSHAHSWQQPSVQRTASQYLHSPGLCTQVNRGYYSTVTQHANTCHTVACRSQGSVLKGCIAPRTLSPSDDSFAGHADDTDEGYLRHTLSPCRLTNCWPSIPACYSCQSMPPFLQIATGTIGGVANNALGVAGVTHKVKMISGKFLGAQGGTTAGAIRAVDYMTDLKVGRRGWSRSKRCMRSSKSV